MSYLNPSDYNRAIQPASLQQVTGSNMAVLQAAEATAIAEATSYLVQKYDVQGEFAPAQPYDATVAYPANARVTSNTPADDTLYFAPPPCPVFSATKAYQAGDAVFWAGSTYTCQVATPALSSDEALQYATISNMPAHVYPGAGAAGQQYWGSGTPYSVPAGTPLTNTTYWQQGDNRDMQLVTSVLNITLYYLFMRVSPKNMPLQRTKAYTDAVHWLTLAANGQVTPALPPLQPAQGARIRFGGNLKIQNTY